MLRTRVLAGIVAVVVAIVLVTAPAASAHADLLSSSPKTGEALASAPTEVTLQFTADVMTVGAAVVVADGDGTDWTAGDPVIDGAVVTVPLREGMPDSGYELRWRVVSSDGHPIADVIPFTIGDAEPLSRSNASDPSPVPADAGQSKGSEVGAATDQSTTSGDVLRAVAIGAGGAVAAVAVFVLFLFFRRRPGAGTGTASQDAPGES
ncbi:copper resistance CopC family protein [Microbacterium sp.]|uniref:copper resistance CopC family protein n=1 Tax=Microbacterium sp. TaxID=51671 RepID=UPI003A8ABBE0